MFFVVLSNTFFLVIFRYFFGVQFCIHRHDNRHCCSHIYMFQFFLLFLSKRENIAKHSVDLLLFFPGVVLFLSNQDAVILLFFFLLFLLLLLSFQPLSPSPSYYDNKLLVFPVIDIHIYSCCWFFFLLASCFRFVHLFDFVVGTVCLTQYTYFYIDMLNIFV